MKLQNSSSSQPDPVKIKYCGCNDETCSPDDCLFCSPTGYEDCPVCSPFECLTKCKSCEECDGSGECVNICDTQNCEECVEFEENGQTISRCESKCGQDECCNGSGECRPCGCESAADCPKVCPPGWVSAITINPPGFDPDDVCCPEHLPYSYFGTCCSRDDLNDLCPEQPSGNCADNDLFNPISDPNSEGACPNEDLIAEFKIRACCGGVCCPQGKVCCDGVCVECRAGDPEDYDGVWDTWLYDDCCNAAP